MDKAARIYIAGAHTLVGRALHRRLARQGYAAVIHGDDEGALTDAAAVDAFFARTAPSHVFVVGGRSGGIRANQKYPADLMLNNLLMACHVLHGAYRHGVTKLLYLASSCVYPKHSPQPMRVDALLTGPLEETSEAYAVAKLAGIKLCQAYRQQCGANFVSGIPADAFGPGDDFSFEDSHVVAALMRKMHEAKTAGAESVEIWGTGTPRREFIFTEDLADACIHVMRAYNEPHPINLGGGSEFSIGELAELVKEIVGYPGALRFDTSKPDGMPSKVLDWSVLRDLGWRPRVSVRSALSQTYAWFLTAEQRSGAVGAH